MLDKDNEDELELLQSPWEDKAVQQARIASQTAEFLANGGIIQQIDPDVCTWEPVDRKVLQNPAFLFKR